MTKQACILTAYRSNHIRNMKRSYRPESTLRIGRLLDSDLESAETQHEIRVAILANLARDGHFHRLSLATMTTIDEGGECICVDSLRSLIDEIGGEPEWADIVIGDDYWQRKQLRLRALKILVSLDVFDVVDAGELVALFPRGVTTSVDVATIGCVEKTRSALEAAGAKVIVSKAAWRAM